MSDERSPAEWVAYGRQLQQAERNTSALAAFDRALALEPELAAAWAAKALLFEDLERLEDAAAIWLHLVELNPADSGAWSNLGGVQLGLEQLPEALASLERAQSLDPENALLAFNRGMLLWQGFNRVAEAAVWLEKASAAGLPEATEALDELRRG